MSTRTSTVDLKALRESVTPEVTQAELGRRLGKDQGQVSRWERDPDSIPVSVLHDICDALGLDLATALTSRGKALPGGLAPGDAYASQRDAYERLTARIVDGTHTTPDILDGLPAPIPSRQEVIDSLVILRRKPVVGVFGSFDSGKSTLLNDLLGGDFLPTGYAPLTSIPLYVRHLGDRPTWMREDAAWVFGTGWRSERWHDEDHCNEYRIVAGDKDMLADYASHQGTSTARGGAVGAVMYVDSPLLLACDVLDSPGFDNTSSDDQHAIDAIEQVDIGVYCKPYIGFMDGGDILRSGRLLRQVPEIRIDGLPPLQNLFFVATHVQPTHPDDAEMQHIFDGATQRSWETWKDHVLEERGAPWGVDITEITLRSRFFTYCRQDRGRSAALLTEMQQLIGVQIPEVRRPVTDEGLIAIRRALEASSTSVLDQYVELSQHRERAERELGHLLEREAERVSDVAAGRRQFHDFVKRSRRKSLADFESKASHIVSEDHVRKIVDRFPSKKEAQKGAVAVVVEELQSAADRVCSRESAGATAAMTEFLGAYEKASQGPGTVATPFNVEGAFLGGLAGLTSVGALAVWASTLGNLGGYILAAKFTSVLAALGISISGGTASVVGALAAIGGPATVALAIVALAIIAGLAIFGSWESRLTKAIRNHLKKKKVVDRISQQIDDYWTQTSRAFDQGADNVDRDYLAYLNELEQTVRATTPEQIAEVIEHATVARHFYRSLPW